MMQAPHPALLDTESDPHCTELLQTHLSTTQAQVVSKVLLLIDIFSVCFKKSKDLLVFKLTITKEILC